MPLIVFRGYNSCLCIIYLSYYDFIVKECSASLPYICGISYMFTFRTFIDTYYEGLCLFTVRTF
jgi:hypothetical protein